MNRLFNGLLHLKRNSLLSQQMFRKCFQIKTELNFHKIYCFESNKNIFNNCLNSRHLLSINRLNVNQKTNYSSNAKNERKIKSKSDMTSIESEFQSLKSKKRLLRKKQILNKSEKHLPILAFSTAEEYNIEDLSEGFKNQGLYELMPFSEEVEDVLHLTAKYEINQNRRELFVFRFFSLIQI